LRTPGSRNPDTGVEPSDFGILAIWSSGCRGGCGLGAESFKLPVHKATKRSGPSISEDTWQRFEPIRVSDTGRLKDQEFGHGRFVKSQILKSRKVHAVEVSGKSPKRDFGNSVTRKTRGKSSELLTHKTPKGYEPLDQERL
jgi:hypothetical protein